MTDETLTEKKHEENMGKNNSNEKFPIFPTSLEYDESKVKIFSGEVRSRTILRSWFQVPVRVVNLYHPR